MNKLNVESELTYTLELTKAEMNLLQFLLSIPDAIGGNGPELISEMPELLCKLNRIVRNNTHGS